MEVSSIVLIALLMLPGLALLVFIVIQFAYRGKHEADAAERGTKAQKREGSN